MAITESIELLGKGLYENIPDTLTLQQLTTSSELDYVGSEDFDKVMVETILPQAIVEDIDCKQLLEIDYQWVLRCLRILNYGPYFTTNLIICDDCNNRTFGEYTVNLMTIQCKGLPEGFMNDIIISKDEFIDFDGDIHIKLPTIQNMMNAQKDKAFQTASGSHNRELARICYMVSSIKGNSNLSPLERKMFIQNNLSPADYILLKDRVLDLTDYGLRAGGVTQCPKCGSKEAAFIALVDDRFFRPTVGDLRKWKDDRSSRRDEDISRDKKTAV